MAGSIENRLFSPRVLRRPFDLQKWRARDQKVNELLVYVGNRRNRDKEHFPRKVADLIHRISPALAYKALDTLLGQNPAINDACGKKLDEQVLEPLKKKINSQINRRQAAVAGSAVASLLLLTGLAIYFIYYWGKAEEQAALNAFSKSLDGILENGKQKTDLTDEADLQRKLSGRITDFGPSFSPLRYPDNIHHPRNYSIAADLAVDLSKYPTSAQVLSAARRLPQPELGVISTWASDNRLSGPDHSLASANADFSRHDFSDFYRRVAGAPIFELPDLRSFRSVIMLGIDTPLDGIPMDFLSVLFFNGKQAREWHFLPDFDNLRIFYSSPSSIAAWQSVYSYVQHFSREIDIAAGILARAHLNSLRENNLRVFLRDDLIAQQLEMTAEDPWQDRAACIKVGCSQLKRIESVYQEYSDKTGVKIWGKRRDLPWWAWWLASVTYKYDLEKQALGPAQVIIGLAGRAASQSEILRRYRPFLSEGDFSSSDDIIRTTLDPKKAIFTKAMVFDYIFSELEKTLFSDPNFREPITVAPFISDLRTAREYSLMYLANILAMFPEYDFLAAKLLSAPHRSYYVNLLHVADLSKIKLVLPGLLYYRWESPDTVIYSEFMF